MNATTQTCRIVHLVKGSSAVKAWAFEPDQDGEGGWLAIKWRKQAPGKVSAKHVNSWTPGLLLAAESAGRSVGRLMNSLLGRGDLARGRQARGLNRAPGLYRGEA